MCAASAASPSKQRRKGKIGWKLVKFRLPKMVHAPREDHELLRGETSPLVNVVVDHDSKSGVGTAPTKAVSTLESRAHAQKKSTAGVDWPILHDASRAQIAPAAERS